MKFVGQSFQQLQHKQDRHTNTDRHKRTHYHAAYVGGKYNVQTENNNGRSSLCYVWPTCSQARTHRALSSNTDGLEPDALQHTEPCANTYMHKAITEQQLRHIQSGNNQHFICSQIHMTLTVSNKMLSVSQEFQFWQNGRSSVFHSKCMCNSKHTEARADH